MTTPPAIQLPSRAQSPNVQSAPATTTGDYPSAAEPGTGSSHHDLLAELMAGSAAGDTAAFERLYRETSRAVYGVIFRVLKSADHADEVTQEVYVMVWQQCATYERTLGNVGAWMNTIAHRRAVDRVRSVSAAAARDRVHQARTHVRDIDDVWEGVVARADAARVQQALVSLTPRHREAIALAYFGGHTQAGIALQLDVPLGTVKTRIRDGLRHLRVVLDAG